MSAVDIEYKKRKLKIHYDLDVTIQDTGFMVSDHTTETKFIQSQLEKLINDYLSNENTLQMLDEIKSRIKYL